MICPNCGKKSVRSEVDRYKYVESGLNNVWLRGVNVYQCPCGEKFVQIPGIEALHDAIAYHLLKKPSVLTGQEFRFLRKWLGLTGEELARSLGTSRVSISRWENETVKITSATDHLIRLLALRIKEETWKQQMNLEITIQELLETIATKPAKNFSIMITKEMLKRPPFGAKAFQPV